MKVKPGQTVYIHGRKFKAGQEIPEKLESALKCPGKESKKNESPGTGGKRSEPKP